ncbi:MAG TPA: hypothetical protein DET40_23935 [Lentisphaeria bacterium]|nr:MAG: hypothetical protein A2X45_09135 [Lentisphaerae bacterium GWF2_50_93]HCE46609.1 hypothetical protein [Lentisphaeria bacterium]
MYRQIILFILSGLLISTVFAEGDEPKELIRARDSYQSQLKTAAQTCKQKFEGIDKLPTPEEKTKELNRLKTSYQQQLEFIAKSYLSKLDSMRKMPSFNKNQVYAIKDEISNFQKPDASVPPGAPSGKTADGKAGKPADAAKDVAKADKDDEGDDVADFKAPDGTASDEDVAKVQAASLEDAKARNQEEIRKLSLSDLKADWIKERREFAEKRPRPENYVFTQALFNSYAATIPEDKRELEEKRFKQVSGIKDYMSRLMERNTYPRPITLKNGGRATGIMVNPNFIAVKTGGKKYKRLGWDALPVNESASILEYFATMRLKISAAPNISKEQLRREAAEDFLRIGMLCDWYEEYEDAVKYAKKAVEADPKIEDIVKKYMMQ